MTNDISKNGTRIFIEHEIRSENSMNSFEINWNVIFLIVIEIHRF